MVELIVEPRKGIKISELQEVLEKFLKKKKINSLVATEIPAGFLLTTKEDVDKLCSEIRSFFSGNNKQLEFWLDEEIYQPKFVPVSPELKLELDDLITKEHAEVLTKLYHLQLTWLKKTLSPRDIKARQFASNHSLNILQTKELVEFLNWGLLTDKIILK